jgi:tetratricopeptide (TPR) repeat protein
VALEGEQRFERFGQGTLLAVLAHVNLVRALVELGYFGEAMAHGEEAIQIAEQVDHPASLLLACWAAGLPYLRKGEVARAIPWLQRGVRICREIELPTFAHWVSPPLGAAYALAGRTSDAVQLLEDAVTQDLALNILSQHSLMLVHLAEAYLLAGCLQLAGDQATRALDLARNRKERGYQGWALRLLGEIAAQSDPPEVEPAEVHYQQALALAWELGMRPLVAHCHHGLGMLYHKIGRLPEAHAELSAAMALYRAMEMTFWLPQAEAALAQVEGR